MTQWEKAQTWQPDFYPQDPRKQRRDLTLKDCPLTFIHVLWHTCTITCTHIYTVYTNNNQVNK